MSIKKHRPADEDEGGATASPVTKKARFTEPVVEKEGTKPSKEELRQKKKEKKEKKKAKKEAKLVEKGEKKEKTELTEEEKAAKKEKKAKKLERKLKRKVKAEQEQGSEDASSASEDQQDTSSETAATNGIANGHVEPANTTTNGTANGSYRQTDALTALPDSDIQAFLKKEQVAVHDPLAAKDAAPLRPILEFAHLPKTALTKKSPFAAYKAPTPIQAASWPFSLSGRDLVGIAETGSGKTMAFALPCVEALRALEKPAAVEAKKLPNRSRLNNKWDAKGNIAQALAVIVSPTRELAMQTHAAIQPLAALVGLNAVCLYGGASKDDQRVLLRQAGGVDIIVATPGRLKDFLADEAVSLAHVKFAVLDEADRMLDTGFEEDIKYILGQCPDRAERQTLMFTATWPTSVRGLADGFMVDPVKITVGSRTRAGLQDGEPGTEGVNDGGRSRTGAVELQANARIAQTVEVVDQREKERRLLQVLRQEQRGKAKNDRILVFCLYKKEAVRVENFLQGQGVRVCSIHGNLRQEQRTSSLEAFKTGSTPVLVATDVAARGLDIPEVKLVINVTFPLTIEDYVHRIGRTGRAGKEGRALTFFTEHDKAHSGSLINVLKSANQPVPEELMKFGTAVKRKAHGDYGAFFKDVDMSQKGKKITFD